MTASDDIHGAGAAGPSGSDRTIGDRAMDVFVYAPAGAVLTVLDDLPDLAAKGRTRLGQDLRNAQVVGRFAVQLGWREVRHQLESLTGEHGLLRPPASPPAGRSQVSAPHAPPPGETPPPPSSPPFEAGGPAEASGDVEAPSEARGAPGDVDPPVFTSLGPSGAPGAAPRDPAVDGAIPDYDTLSASQVVRRLDGLGPDELRAVVRRELATRGRRTIVHRAEELLGEPRPPGASGS